MTTTRSSVGINFKLVPVTGQGLPSDHDGADVRPNVSFSGVANTTPSGSGWALRISGSTVGWLDRNGAALTWFALDSALTTTKFFPVTATAPLVFLHSSPPPSGNNFKKIQV